MIEFCYETDFVLTNEEEVSNWIHKVVEQENSSVINIVYIFCDDEKVLELNKQYLDHDTYTDILTFPYENSDSIQADIFISIPRVQENARTYEVSEDEEVRRVMIHGVLHLLGYDDHDDEHKERMRQLETEKLSMFHVEQ